MPLNPTREAINASNTPRQDYLRLSRDFVTALQSHIRQFEDHPEIFNPAVLEAAYRTQSTILQQHFSVLSIMYDRTFVTNETDPTDAVKESSIILP